MSLLNKITDAINTFPEDNKLYLIEKCSEVPASGRLGM